jgi:hypothetical protein
MLKVASILVRLIGKREGTNKTFGQNLGISTDNIEIRR